MSSLHPSQTHLRAWLHLGSQINKYLHSHKRQIDYNFISEKPQMKQAKQIRTFEPEINFLQRKNSPLRLSAASRIYQLNMSRMLFRFADSLPESNQFKETQQIMIVQSHSPKKVYKDGGVSLRQNGRRTKLELQTRLKKIQSKEDITRQYLQQDLPVSPSKTDVHHRNFSEIVQKSVNTRKANYSIRLQNTNNKKQTSSSNKSKIVSSMKPKLLPQLKEQKPATQVTKKLPLLNRVPEQLKNVKSESYIVMEHPSNTVVVAYRSTMSLEIASLTKIMTFYVALKIARQRQIDIVSYRLPIADHIMQVTGTSAQLVGGQVYTIEQLLYGLMLPSGNDAATCLAEWGGQFFTEDPDPNTRTKHFIQQMNRTAKNLNLSNTRFGNVHGLPHFQSKSNAQEVARLSSICIKDEFFCQVVSRKKYKCRVKNEVRNSQREVQWENTNKLLRRQGFLGIKTGITVTAGPCLVTAYRFKDIVYITAILRATKISRRFKETRRLLYWSLNKIWANNLTECEKKTLGSLKRNRHDLDSDNSEEEQEFKYDISGAAEFKKRCNIINCQM